MRVEGIIGDPDEQSLLSPDAPRRSLVLSARAGEGNGRATTAGGGSRLTQYAAPGACAETSLGFSLGLSRYFGERRKSMNRVILLMLVGLAAVLVYLDASRAWRRDSFGRDDAAMGPVGWALMVFLVPVSIPVYVYFRFRGRRRV